MGLTQVAARKARSAVNRLRRAVRTRLPAKPLEPAEAFTDCYRRLPLDPDLVLYQAHSGAAMACNPYAIFTALLDDPDYAHLTHVWVLDSTAELRRRRQEYADRPNVRFVKDGAAGYFRALATAKYLVQNTSFSAYFVKRPGQVYVNTWHSITVKTLGYDVPGGNHGTRNMVRNFLMADYLVSPNLFMTGIFADSFKLRGLFPNRVLEVGYPRNDVTLHTPRAEVIDELRSRGIAVDPAKKIILYAPTWRGTLSDIQGGTEELEQVREQLAAGVDADEYQILVKPHQFHYGRLTREQKQSGRYVPRQFNANRLLAAVDVLISDYSSIAFDFLVTDRPVLFYIPDLADYASQRGIYFTTDELPGPVTADAADLAGWINDLPAATADRAGRYADLKARLCGHEDGRAAERVVAAVFGGREVAGTIDGLLEPSLTRVLLHVDDLDDSDTTEALLGLAASLDPARYDVTVAGIGHSEQSRENAARLTSRTLVRAGRPTLSRREAAALEVLRRFGPIGPVATLLPPDPALRREWRRRFGDARFDVVVECSRRPGIFGWLAKLASGAKLVVWQPPDQAPATPAETASGPAEGVARPLGSRSLAKLRRAADAVAPSHPTPQWVQLLSPR